MVTADRLLPWQPMHLSVVLYFLVETEIMTPSIIVDDGQILTQMVVQAIDGVDYSVFQVSLDFLLGIQVHNEE